MQHSRIITAVLLLLNAVNLLILFLQYGAIISNDSLQYQQLADGIGNGIYHEAVRLIGYPFFIFFFQNIFGHSASAVIFPQIILCVAALYLTFAATKNAFGEMAGYIFLVLALTFQVISFSAIAMLPEMPTVFLFSLAIFLLSKNDYRKKALSFAAAGMLFGISFYFRPNVLPIMFFAALPVFIVFSEYRKSIALLIAVLLMTVAPQTIYNYAKFSMLSPTTAHCAFEFVVYQTTLESLSEYENYDNYEAIKDERIQAQLAGIKQSLGIASNASIGSIYADTSPEYIRSAKLALRRAALENINYDPLSYFSFVLRNIPRMWIASYLSPEGDTPVFRAVRLLWGLLVLFLAAIGCYFAVCSTERNIRFFGVLAVGILSGFTFFMSWLHLEARYTNTAKPLLLSCAAFGVCQLRLKFFRWR
jgi:hypothetical protein